MDLAEITYLPFSDTRPTNKLRKFTGDVNKFNRPSTFP
jgi:hypothetical protein